MSHGSNAHEQCVTRCPVFGYVDSLGRQASVTTYKNSTQHPSITVLRFQLTGLARLSYNHKLDFWLRLTKVPGFLQSEPACFM